MFKFWSLAQVTFSVAPPAAPSQNETRFFSTLQSQQWRANLRYKGMRVREGLVVVTTLVMALISLSAPAQQRRAASRAPAAPDRSLENLIQDTVVRACDRINTKRSTCGQMRAEAPRTAPPVVAEVLKRCDPKRQDAPPSQSVNNSENRAFDVSVVSAQEAQQVFDFIRPQKSRYALTGAGVANRVCAQRAQMVAFDLLDQCKMKSAKIFVQPSRSRLALGLWRNSLEVEVNGQSYSWDKYHVANVIYVRQVDGRTEPYVLDPLLFQEPVPMATWEALLKKTDPRASSFLTSPSTYTASGISSDDPTKPLSTAQAESDLSLARRQAREMQR